MKPNGLGCRLDFPCTPAGGSFALIPNPGAHNPPLFVQMAQRLTLDIGPWTLDFNPW
jgi:hypothetical protein